METLCQSAVRRPSSDRHSSDGSGVSAWERGSGQDYRISCRSFGPEDRCADGATTNRRIPVHKEALHRNASAFRIRLRQSLSPRVIPKPDGARDLTRHRHGTLSIFRVEHEIPQSLHSFGMTLRAHGNLLPTGHTATPLLSGWRSGCRPSASSRDAGIHGIIPLHPVILSSLFAALAGNVPRHVEYLSSVRTGAAPFSKSVASTCPPVL